MNTHIDADGQLVTEENICSDLVKKSAGNKLTTNWTPASNLKILHLEDLKSDAELVNNILKKASFTFERLVVDTKQQYVDALKYFSPDIILADHSLPSFNSHQALLIMQEMNIKVPFILITATISEDFAVDVIKKGADDYLLKDRLTRLPSAIQNALEKHYVEKESEAALEKLTVNEEKFRALVENSGDAVGILNAKGKITYVSPNIVGVLGYTDEEFMQLDLVSIFHVDDILSVQNVMVMLLANPGVTMKGHTGRMLHKDGSWRWIEATATNLLHDPAINGIVDNFRDITERKLAEENLVSNEKKFRALIENNADGMALLSAEGKPLYVSPSIKNVLGYSHEEGLTLDLLSAAHPDDVQSLMSVMGKVMQNPGLPVKGDAIRIRHKDGNWRWVEGVLTNMLHDPAIAAIVDNFRDVTEQKLSGEALKDSEAKYRSFFENSLDGILLTVTDGEVLAANAAACRMFQMTEEEICKLGRFGLVDVDDRRIDAFLKQRQLHGKVQGELTLVRKDGTRFTAEITSAVFKDVGGHDRTSMIVRDVTERKLAEQLLQESELFNKSVLASLSSHIAVIDTTGKIISTNKAWDDFAKANGKGLLERTSVGSNYFDVCKNAIGTPDETVALQALDGILSVFKKENPRFEFEYSCDSRTENRWFTLRVVNFGSDDSKVVISHQNITQRKEAELALKESELNLKAIFENTSDGFILADADGFIKALNSNAKDLAVLNIGRELKIKESIYEFISEPRRESFKTSIAKVLSGEVFQYEYYYERKNEEIFWLNIIINPVHTAAGIVGICITSTDITERKKSEKELSQSESRLKEAQTVAKIGSWETNLQTFEVTWSDETYRIFDVNPETFVVTHETFLNCVHKDDRTKVDDAFKNSNEGNTLYSVLHRICTPEGKEKTIEECWSIFVNDEGMPLKATGTCQDITERVKSHELIALSQSNLNAIIENTDSYIYSLDRDFKYITFNSAVKKMMKDMYGLDITPGYPIFDFINKFDSAATKEWTDIYTKGLNGDTVKFEKESVVDEVSRYTSFSIHPMWENKNVIGVSCFVNDITPKKLAEETQRQSDARYRRIVETAQEGIWVIDAESKTTFVNRKLCEILEYSAQEMLGKTTLFFKDDKGRQEAGRSLERRKAGINENYESAFISKSGKQIWTDVSTNAIFDEAGKYEGSLAMVTDITEKKKLEQKLAEEQIASQIEIMRAVVDAQERERAGIGAELHDNVNQLLATSKMYISICLSRQGNNKESLLKGEEYIGTAIEEVRKLSHALVGPTQDKIMGLIPSIEDLIFDIAHGKSINIKFVHPSFKEDRNEVGLKLVIYRIIQEQINNILKHAQASEINLELKKQGKDLVVNINDDGVGFDMNLQHRGIGLTNISNRARLYNGTVQIISSPGNGCNMKIVFKNHGIGAKNIKAV